MRTVIVSYSNTGNNRAFARDMAAILPADHVEVTESKSRSMATIVLDVLFGRIPKVAAPDVDLGAYDLVVFVGPVWMGRVASPLRAWFKAVGLAVRRYAWASVSGGADGPNPNLGGELTKRLGKAPVAVIDAHIADLLPPEPKPTRKVTMAYRISDGESRQFAEQAVTELRRAGS